MVLLVIRQCDIDLPGLRPCNMMFFWVGPCDMGLLGVWPCGMVLPWLWYGFVGTGTLWHGAVLTGTLWHTIPLTWIIDMVLFWLLKCLIFPIHNISWGFSYVLPYLVVFFPAGHPSHTLQTGSVPYFLLSGCQGEIRGDHNFRSFRLLFHLYPLYPSCNIALVCVGRFYF